MKYFASFLFVLFLISCTKTKDLAEDKMVIPPSALDKIIVHLEKGTDIKMLENEFVKYKLKMKSFASRSQNSYLFTFDSESISSEKMIKLLNKRDEVIAANNIVDKLVPARSSESGTKSRIKISDQ